MPTQDFGIYADALTEGTEVSSTGGGRHVTLFASELICDAVEGTAIKGWPCVFGLTALKQVGICLRSTSTATDRVAIDTEGIWNVLVSADDDNGACVVYGGDRLFINVETCIVSKITNIATQIPFGYALGQIASGEDVVIAVKVHQDPNYDTDLQLWKTLDEADPTTNFGAYSAAFKLIVDHDIAQTDGRLCAMSINLEPGDYAIEDIVGTELVTYIGATAIAHSVIGAFVEVQGGSSIAGDWNALSVYSAPGADPGGTAHVVKLESNPGTITWQDSFINFVGDPNFTFYHSGQGTAGASTGTHTTGQAGFLLVNMGGVTRYIALYAS